MKRTSLLIFSDIHFGIKESENQSYVIDAFVNDAILQINSRPNNDIHIICNGDLVQAADDNTQYQQFNSDILKRIIQKTNVSIDKVLLIPGNHDVQKSIIEENKEKHFTLLKSLDSEDKFNLGISQSIDSFKNLFNNFCKIANEYPSANWDELWFKEYTINEQWVIACLNTSLSSYAHIDGICDEKKLGIETHSLNSWLKATEGKRRILFMHHPIDSLADWAADELKSIVKRYFDVIVTGHTHSQELFEPKGTNRQIIRCHLPHLFHDKNEYDMGYCILDFDNNDNPEKIQYRQWNPRRKKFVPGVSFTDDEGGIEYLQNREIEIEEDAKKAKIRQYLETAFKESMLVYQNIPDIKWVNRKLSTKRVDHNISIDDKELYNEELIFDSDESIVILSPRNYGLTCYGRHFAMKLWSEREEFAFFVENPNLKIPQLESTIAKDLRHLEISNEMVKWFVVDEWVLPQKQRKDIISFLQQYAPNAKLLLLSPRLEKFFNDNDEFSMFDGFRYLYMTPLKRNQIRSIANTFNNNTFIAEEEVLLKRLDDDIRTFNMHRSPFNCITLLYIFKNSFEENPVNRTEVLEKVLDLIFDNDKTPTYSTIPDKKDCRYVLGKLCELLIRRNNTNLSFTKAEFITNINGICSEQMISVDSYYLFDLLLRNHLILPYADAYRFRSSYWVYFFCAIQMQIDNDFASYMLQDERYLHYPLLMEFYSGLNRQQDTAARTVIKDFQNCISKVRDKIGIPNEWNPYGFLKYTPTDNQKQRLMDSLENEIGGSNLPDEVKDSFADIDYDQRKPFNQDVYRILEQYAVVNLMNFIPIASRVLRNSDYVNRELKIELFDLVITSWKVLVETLALLTPTLAIKGHVTYGGASFECIGNIEEEMTPTQKIMNVLASIPSNVIRWFEGDLYSNRNAPLYYDYITKSRNIILRHLVASLVMRQLPDNWETAIKSYLSSIDANSFYLADSVIEMRITYSTKVISNENANRMKNFMLTSIGRQRTKQSFVSPKLLDRVVSSEDIPKRKQEEKDDCIEE